MAKSKIEWTDVVWNPVTGCTKVSQGCKHCYAETMAKRLKAMGRPEYQDVIGEDGRWNGTITLVKERLEDPLKWKKPRRVFVNSMSDLFHLEVPNNYIADVIGTMQRTPQHTYIILTKRPKRMMEYFIWLYDDEATALLPNVWLGVSVEDQATANLRIPNLLQTPAAVRFVSYEPALGPVDLKKVVNATRDSMPHTSRLSIGLDWIIMGGESGPGARPMHPDWARNVRDQCQAAGVPFFFKQWGEWMPVCPQYSDDNSDDPGLDELDMFGHNICLGNRGTLYREDYGLKEEYWCGYQPDPWQNPWFLERVGKKKAGRLLDGREWNEIYRKEIQL
jgi:protein gp37